MDSNRIHILNCVANAIIGVRSHEKLAEQKLSIDFSFPVEITQASNSDSLSDTIDYSVICHSIITFVEKCTCQLLETLASRLADHLSEKFKLTSFDLSITKYPIDIPQVSGIKIVVERRSA